MSLAPVPSLAESPTGASAEFFEKKVRPVLVEKCHRCHGGKLQKGGLRLDSRESLLKGGDSGPVVSPGHPEKSELVRAINYDADGFQMPPTGKLDADSIEALTEWIREGAPWPDHSTGVGATQPGARMDFAARAKHWSFQPLRRTAVPSTAEPSWPNNPVDAFLASRLQAAGCQHADAADRRTLLRRITFDLTGLPTTIDELSDFLADKSPLAFESVVDRLLASPHYGVRWGRHWLDLVRFAETYGHEFDYPIAEAWRYRDYVVRALNDDLPYDTFVTEHIAGDLLVHPRRNPRDRTNESTAATAFWWFGQAKHSPVDLRAEECDRLDNQIDVMGKAFLGLSIACARCHDHKFDPIRAQDYYSLTGFLRSSRQQFAFLADPRPVADFASWKRSCEPRCAALIGRLLNPKTWREGSDDDEVLHAWHVLKSVPAGPSFVAHRQRLADDINHRQELAHLQESKSTLFDDFCSPSFDRWRPTGTAFGSRPSRAGDFVLGTSADRSIVEFAEPGAAHSGLISSRLKGALRSRSFTIEKPFIHYRAARHQGDGGSGRPYKSGQLNLIVDGFQIIRDPLWGQLSLTVANDAPAAWYSQNVSKLIGNRAYIEILDEDDGWISVDSIRFSDDPSPPTDRPNGLIRTLLNDDSIDSPTKLANAYENLFVETVSLWRSGRLADDRFAKSRVAFLNSLCGGGLNARARFTDRGRIPLTPDPSPARGEGREIVGERSSSSPQRSSSSPLSPRRRGAGGEGEFFHRSARIAHGDLERRQETGDLARLLDEYRRRESALAPSPRVLALADGSAENDHVLIRGNPRKPGDETARRFLEVFQAAPIGAAEAGSGRLELAKSMTGSASALLARVIVNRLWHHHFGRGLVASTDDFGKMGERPSHPELLDFLAAELIKSGWSIKHLQRLLVTSTAYRMSSREPDARSKAADPENRLVHRAAVKRLEAEAIRDSILAASGRLDERLEGPGVRVHLDDFMTGRGRPSVSGPLDGAGRRSLYLEVRRNFLPPLFLAFDFPIPATAAGRRAQSNVPAQALTLLNDPFVAQQAQAWAKRIWGQAQASPAIDALLTRLYETAFARLPTADERALAREFLRPSKVNETAEREQAWAELCHVLFNVKEFLYVN
ncbi:MAG TPA: PSD1 and planctomycete cytochrome C domain-containing protein [Planctomycetaceae bacterium]|nr:PSD1 and planctomycete cytochrome C domain-containing protein [Planctomycetaceae bacterium]